MPEPRPPATADTLSSPGRIVGLPPFRRIRFACPACETKLSIPVSQPARKLRCPDCDRTLVAADPIKGKPAIAPEAVFHEASSGGIRTLPEPRLTKLKPGPGSAFRGFTTVTDEEAAPAVGLEDEWGEAGTRERLGLAHVRRASILELYGPWIAITVAAAAIWAGSTLYLNRKPALDPSAPPAEETGGVAAVAGDVERLFDEFGAEGASVEERLHLVLGGGAIGDRIRHHEARYPKHRIVPDTRTLKLIEPDDPGPRRAFLVGRSAGRLVRLLVQEAAPGRWAFDWESAVGYCETDWDEFVSDRPDGPRVMRVFASPDNYYNYEFKQRSRFVCVKLQNLQGSASCWGYAPVNSEIGRRLTPAVISGRPAAVTLQLEFPPADPDHPERPRNQVWIREIVSSSWLVD